MTNVTARLSLPLRPGMAGTESARPAERPGHQAPQRKLPALGRFAITRKWVFHRGGGGGITQREPPNQRKGSRRRAGHEGSAAAGGQPRGPRAQAGGRGARAGRPLRGVPWEGPVPSCLRRTPRKPRSPPLPSLPAPAACRPRPAEAPRYSLPMAAAGREQRASGGGGLGETRQGLVPAAHFRFLPRAGFAGRRRHRAGAVARTAPSAPTAAPKKRLQLPSCTAARVTHNVLGGRRVPGAYWLPRGYATNQMTRRRAACWEL